MGGWGLWSRFNAHKREDPPDIHLNRLYVMAKYQNTPRMCAIVGYTFVIGAVEGLGEILLRNPDTSPKVWVSMMNGKQAGLRALLDARSDGWLSD